jgi:hypothetical protein
MEGKGKDGTGSEAISSPVAKTRAGNEVVCPVMHLMLQYAKLAPEARLSTHQLHVLLLYAEVTVLSFSERWL